MAALGVYISELRSLRGFTQKQVGDAAGVTDSSVRTWEKGQHEPGAGALIKMLDFLGGAFEDADLLLRSGDDQTGRLLALHGDGRDGVPDGADPAGLVAADGVESRSRDEALPAVWSPDESAPATRGRQL